MTRRHLWFAVQLAGTLVLGFVVLRGLDWTSFAAVLRRLSAAFYVGSLAAVVAGQLFYAFRWQVVLAGMGIAVPYGEVLQQYAVGLFFGNLMPSSVGGDAAKVFYLGRRAGYVEVGASVFTDRFLGFLWLSVLGAMLSWTQPAPSPLFVLNRQLMTMFAGGFVTLLVVAGVAPLDRLAAPLQGSGAKTRTAGLVDVLLRFLTAARQGGSRWLTLAVSGGVVFVYVAMMCAVYLWYFAVVGAPVPGALQVANVIVSMSVFVNVPISVNGIGLREQLHYLLLAVLGLPKEISVSISLLMFSHFLLMGVAGYVVWIRGRITVAGAAV